MNAAPDLLMDFLSSSVGKQPVLSAQGDPSPGADLAPGVAGDISGASLPSESMLALWSGPGMQHTLFKLVDTSPATGHGIQHV